MHFVAVDISLQQPAKRLLTVADAPYAHAAILSAISAVNPDVGRQLHDAKQDKRLGIALIDSDYSPESAQSLRVVIISPAAVDYAGIVFDALSRQSTLQLGRTSADIRNVAISGTPWSGVATWADLIGDQAELAMRFEFVTPTAIMKQDDHGRRFSALLPEPQDIFRSLIRRWQALEGPPLPDHMDTYLHGGGCVIAHHHIRTIEYQTQNRTQIGFVGTVTYQCRKYEPACISALNALARLAFFTGIGYQTARGMGLVRTTCWGSS